MNAWLNGALYVTMVFTIFSGIVVSRFVLPALGLAPSTLKAWLDLHTIVASVTLVIIGLHVALNWDWIKSVVRQWRAGQLLWIGISALVGRKLLKIRL